MSTRVSGQGPQPPATPGGSTPSSSTKARNPQTTAARTGGTSEPVALRALEPEPSAQKILDDGSRTQAAVSDAFVESGAGASRQANGGMVLRRLQRAVEAAERSSTAPLRPSLTRAIEARQHALANLLLRGQVRTGTDASRLARAYGQLAQALTAAGLDTPEVRGDLQQLAGLVRDRVAAGLGLQLVPVRAGTLVIGFVGQRKDGAPLTQKQRAGVQALDTLALDQARRADAPTHLGLQNIVLLQLRDALLHQAALGLQQGPPPEMSGANVPTHSPLGMTANALSVVDGMLHDAQPLPPRMLHDLAGLAQKLGTGDGASLQSLLGSAAGNGTGTGEKPGTTGSGRRRTSGFSTSLAGSFAERAKSLAKLRAPTTPQAPAAPQAPLSAPAAPSGAAADGLNQSLLQLLAGSPDHLGDDVAQVIDAYNQASTGVQGALGSLPPFAYVLPKPMEYDDGKGTRFVVPAGATLQHTAQGYSIESSSLLMQSGGVTFAAGHSSIDLGPDVDNLNLASLSLDAPFGHMLLSGVDANVDRKQQTSFVRADTAHIDVADGTVDLTGATMSLNAAHDLDVTARSFSANLLGTSADLQDFNLQSTNKDGTSTLAVQSGATEVHDGKAVLQADKLQLDIIKRADGSQQGVMHAQGLVLDNGTTHLHSATADLAIIEGADGSSHIDITGTNLAVATGGGQLTTQGPSHIHLDYDAAGHLRQAKVQGSAFDYHDAGGASFQGAAGDVGMRFGADGSLQDLEANLQKGTFTNAAGKLDVGDGTLGLHYTDGRLASAHAAAGRLDFTGTSADAAVTQGSLDMTFDSAGRLSSLAGKAQQAHLSQGDNTATVTGGSVAMQFDSTGALSGLSSHADSLDATLGATHVQGQKADLSLVYTNGQLTDLAAQVGTTTVDGPFGHLESNGKATATLRYNADGTLQHAAAQASDLSLSSSGTNTHLTGGKLALDFGAGGQLAGLHGEAASFHVTQGANVFDGAGASVTAAFDADGALQHADAQVGRFSAGGAFGQVDVTDGAQVDLSFTGGALTGITAHGGAVSFTNPAGTAVSLTGGQASVQLGTDGIIQSIHGAAATVDYASPAGDHITATGVDTQLDFTGGALTAVNAKAGSIDYQGSMGQLATKGDSHLALALRADGSLSSVHADAADLTYGSGSNSLHLVDGSLDATVGPQGNIATVAAQVRSGTYTSSLGTMQLSGGSHFNLTCAADGTPQSFSADVSHFDDVTGKTHLQLDGGTVTGSFGPGGALQKLDFAAKSIDYSGTTAGTQRATVHFDDPHLQLTPNVDGGSTLSFSGQGGSIAVGGNDLGIGQVKQVSLSTNADGTLKGAELDVPGKVSFTDGGGTDAVVQDLKGSYDAATSHISLSFDQATIALHSTGATATIHNASLDADPRQVRLHIGDARLLKEVQKQLDFDGQVEGLDLVLNTDAAGTLQSGDLSLAQLLAKTSSMNVMVHNAAGQRLRLHTEFSKDGTSVREVFLEIPTGGEVKVSTDAGHVEFGPMTAKLTAGDDGSLHLLTHDANVDAVWNGLTVQADSDTIDAALDPTRGLVLNHISGTNIHVKSDGIQADINIPQLDNMLLQMTGVSGLAQGAAIALVPAGDDAHLTAKVSVNYNGLPITLEVDDAGELKAFAQVKPNEVHIYAGDPTRQGSLHVGVGPLKLSGSEIELFLHYRTYDPRRMLDAVGRYLTTDGSHLTRGLSVEPDGVIRLGTTGAVHAEMAVLLPHNMGAPRSYLWSMSDPTYRPQPRDGGGLMASLGYHGETDAGDAYTGSVFVGALPGSMLEWDQTRGKASLYGVPLPNHMTLPTTAAAGLSFQRDTPDSHLDATLGVFKNIAAMAPGGIIDEPVDSGLFGGVSYHTNDFSVGLDAVADKPAAGKLKLAAARLTLGWSF